MFRQTKHILFLCCIVFISFIYELKATDFSDNTFLISEINSTNYKSQRLWNSIKNNNWAGIEINIDTADNNSFIEFSDQPFSTILEKINSIIREDNSKLVPVFLNFNGDVLILDSIINSSEISSQIFFSPQGEEWPTIEYLVQSNRRVIFFIEGNFKNESRILHNLENYTLKISANLSTPNSVILGSNSNINLELFKVDNFDLLTTAAPPNQQSRNLMPDYINYLLENWKKFGKKPNFIFVGDNHSNFDFIVEQLNSFAWIKGKVRTIGKNLEKVYWKNPDVLVTGGKFSFPYRGGEEVILTPFAPGYKMTPEQIIVTTEMVIPENYSVLANPLILSEEITASFNFDGIVLDAVNPTNSFKGENFSFSQDIDRGNVLRLPENASINLGDPELYGLPNSSFTVCCFVKFTEILEFGDNAVLGSYETGYRRGLHLVLRSGHPYFGLYANDFISDVTLKTNAWYHLSWRYIIETGEQTIFLDGKHIGGSDGHPPYSGTSDIHVGSALSQGASLRGYIDNLHIWDRPLGNEEIIRLSSDEEILLNNNTQSEGLLSSFQFEIILIIAGLIALVLIIWILLRLFRKKKEIEFVKINIPTNKNLIQIFGEFRAVNEDSNEVTELFTPKVKELFVFILISTLKNAIGAHISEINEKLWEGIESTKVANNRAVTLNKLRKILIQFDGVEIISQAGYLQLKTKNPFFCDYIEAFKLCQLSEGMTRNQLESFFHLVKKGRLLKGSDWQWLDEVRGFTGNQVLDNLIKLASIYIKENKLKEVEKVAQRILDYDDLNEEAIYLQIWALQKVNNAHLAKYNFNSFCTKYEKNMGEPFPMNFNEFIDYYLTQL